MQTVLHHKNSNKEGHIRHLFREREAKTTDERWHKTWLTLNLHLRAVSVGAARVATLFAGCSPATSRGLVAAFLPSSVVLSADAEVGGNCRNLAYEALWGGGLLSNEEYGLMGLIEIGNGFYIVGAHEADGEVSKQRSWW